MKTCAWGAALLLLGVGCSDDEPETSATDELFDGLGGEDALDALTGLRIESRGSRLLPHEGFRPTDEAVESATIERTVSIDLENDFLRVDTSKEVQILFPGASEYTEILRGNEGASTEPFGTTPLGALGSDKAAAIRRQELLLTPHFLLRELDRDDLTTEDDVQLGGATHHRIVASGGPAPITLYVNADTGELSKLETMELDYYLRDVPLEVFYSDWQPASGGISFPRELRVERDGQPLLAQEVSEVAVDPSFEADTFEFPEGVNPTFDEALWERGELSHQWYFLLDSIGLPFNGVDTMVMRNELAPGVFHLMGASHHSFLVEQANGLVLVDAPLHDDRGKALFDAIEAQFPNKPITHVVASHFHEDHVSGIREVLGSSDAKLVVQESVADFWREVSSSPSTLKPDALEENPREIEIIEVADQLTLPDAEHPVTFYHVTTDHAADMLLTHETSANVVFVVDIFSPGNPTQIAADDLDAALVEYDVPVADLKIAGGHGTTVAGYADLQAQLP